MKTIDKYVYEKLIIGRDIKKENDIDKDFKQLMNLLKKDDADEEITDDLLSLAEFDDDNYEELHYKYSESKFSIFLRTIVNYDWICLRENGTIDIQNSNHKDIAKIISKYTEPEVGKKVYKTFPWH